MTACQQAMTHGGERITLPSSFSANGSTQAGIALRATGDLHRLLNGSSTDVADWLAPKINMGLYEARMTPVSGTLSSGNVNVWEALSADRVYTVATATILKQFDGTLEIRRITVPGTILGTCAVHLQADNI